MKTLKQRIFAVALCTMLFALCASVNAQQQKKIPRIGYLGVGSLNTNTYRTDAFRQGLRQLGYAEGKDFVIEDRDADGKLNQLNELAAELVRLKVDVIVTRGPPSTRAAKAATTTIPIVMTQDPDPVQWVRRQPSAPRWKHYGIIKPCPRDKRQATGTSEGDHSQTLPCSRYLDFYRSGPNIAVKRDRTCGRSIECAASVSRRAAAQGY